VLRTASQRLLGPGILLLIAVLFYWKLTLTSRYTWLEDPDSANKDLPWLQFQAGEWHRGRFPLWDPNGWFGLPLAGQGEPGAAYPLNWLLFLVPLKHGWIRQSALNWYFVLIRYFAALTCYAFARDLGRSRAASVLAGCIYGLGGYVATTIPLQKVNGAVWTPLVFLYLFRAGNCPKARGERPLASAVLSGFFLGFGWLAGHHQMNVFVTIAAAGLWIWLTIREGKLNLPMARLAAVSLIVAVLASAFQTIPMAEYGRRAVRWVGAPEPQGLNEVVPYSVHEQYSLRPVATLGIFLPNLDSNFGFYIGIVAFTLGIAGALLAWRERQVRWLAAIGLGGLFFALGPNSVFHGMIYSLVPLVDKARVPGAASLLFVLGVAPLAAYAADLIPQPENRECLRYAGQWLVIAAAIIGVAAFVIFAAKIQSDGRLIAPAIAGVLAAAIFAGWRNGGLSAPAGMVCVIGLVLFELGKVSTYTFANRYDPSQNHYLHPLAEHADLVAYVRTQGEGARVDYDRQVIPYNIGDWFGIEASGAYLASVTANIWRSDVYSPQARNFFGIKYYFGRSAPATEWQGVFVGTSGLKVFQNPAAFPRVWSVHRLVAGPGEGFDPRRATFLLGRAKAGLLEKTDPGFEGCSGGNDDVQMPVHQPNYIRVTADLECRGMVTLTDTWFPGWRARVDGRTARIYEVYGGVRGVMVDGGRHTIEMRYRPGSVFLGAALSLFAAIAAVWAAVAGSHPIRLRWAKAQVTGA
jgi:hypothetical protein